MGNTVLSTHGYVKNLKLIASIDLTMYSKLCNLPLVNFQKTFLPDFWFTTKTAQFCLINVCTTPYSLRKDMNLAKLIFLLIASLDLIKSSGRFI